MVYNRAYGVLACVAGRFPLKGNYTTNTQRPTVLSWAFLFVESPRHAGLRAIVRVPAASGSGSKTHPVRPCSALSSLEPCTNLFALAHAERLV